ncbi:MAG: ATP-binding cassette domain-containing protein [Candidatus Cloacimonetes bacterium]|nr:ATP-binding cassette domain-containing protein [Candidatus Cloacimonadota bacterium]
MEKVLKITNVHKAYEKVIALQDISLEIEAGSIFGLLGPNGAGKTSLIRILTGITMPDQGSFVLNGKSNNNFAEISRIIGYLPEERGLYPTMKIFDQLMFFGRIKGLSKKEAREKINFYSKKLEIDGWLQKKARELSKGMQQLVQFVGSIFYEPSLIILDEPFTGLDPINSLKLQNEILELQQRGKTIIFSTHRMDQVEEFCQNIALINKGEIILEGRIDEIKNRFKKNIYQIQYTGDCNLSSTGDYEVISNKDCVLTIRDLTRNTSANVLLKSILERIEVVSFIEVLPSLSEIFIAQVQKEGDHEQD